MPVAQAARTGHRLLEAFADPLRLRILNLLRGGELCVGDLVTLLGVPQPTASRHLARLRRAGLVRTRRRGLWVFYALAPAASRFHGRLVGCLGCCCEEVPELRRDLRRATRLRREGGCCPLGACGPEPGRGRTRLSRAPTSRALRLDRGAARSSRPGTRRVRTKDRAG